MSGLFGMWSFMKLPLFDPQETMEQLCVCRETGQVCGNDELTYSSPCALNEESVRRDSAPNLPQLSMAYWGPCIEENCQFKVHLLLL